MPQADLFGHEAPIREPLKPPVLTKAIRKAGHVADNGVGFGSLAAMIASQTRAAAALVVAPEVLAEWHTAQLAWVREKAERIKGVVEGNALKLEAMDPPASPADWIERFWAPMARLNYCAETARLLERRGHILVCPNHGIDGVTTEEVAADVLIAAALLKFGTEEDSVKMGRVYTALSNRGLTEGKPLDWARYCLECQGPSLANLARRMARELVTDAPELEGVPQ